MEKALIRKEIDIMNHLHHNKLINLHDAFEDEDEIEALIPLTWVLLLLIGMIACKLF
jgi:hypothetical protein